MNNPCHVLHNKNHSRFSKTQFIYSVLKQQCVSALHTTTKLARMED